MPVVSVANDQFADDTNSTVVIGIKGTSAGVLGVGGPTAKNDKYNVSHSYQLPADLQDNLFFSCCCARVDFSWTTVCDCFSGGYKCDQTCLEDSLIADSVYSTVGTVSAFPHSTTLAEVRTSTTMSLTCTQTRPSGLSAIQ
jgi:putative lipase involved disintegration of autophagic bodies